MKNKPFIIAGVAVLSVLSVILVSILSIEITKINPFENTLFTVEFRKEKNSLHTDYIEINYKSKDGKSFSPNKFIVDVKFYDIEDVLVDSVTETIVDKDKARKDKESNYPPSIRGVTSDIPNDSNAPVISPKERWLSVRPKQYDYVEKIEITDGKKTLTFKSDRLIKLEKMIEKSPQDSTIIRKNAKLRAKFIHAINRYNKEAGPLREEIKRDEEIIKNNFHYEWGGKMEKVSNPERWLYFAQKRKNDLKYTISYCKRKVSDYKDIIREPINCDDLNTKNIDITVEDRI